MEMCHRITIVLQDMVERDEKLKWVLGKCIADAEWTPPGWEQPISNLDDFYLYLNQLMETTPVESTFSNLFHGLYFIISQQENVLQKEDRFAGFQQWLVLFTEQYGSFMNSAKSANNLYSFTHDKTFEMDLFEVPPGGYNSFNTFFCRHIRPGKRPIGTRTHAFDPPAEGRPIGASPVEDVNLIHERMCDDTVVTMPADSVYKGCWAIDEQDKITVSKGNTYSVETLLSGSRYGDKFKGGLFTHSYLTVFTYHRYHVPVRGRVLETGVISGDVYADVYQSPDGDLHAKDGTGYQFRQDRGLLVLDSPIGLVALLPIGMDVISSCNITVDPGDYVNKGDEFGYFLFGGSDMIVIFENRSVDIVLPEVDKLYKLGQVFARV
ncbi:MAG: phosphatidylserine decarboxylase [Desulfobacterales bacterium]|nr:phosphatidylserine decarboxylase [Desulfobacterales bacterium]